LQYRRTREREPVDNSYTKRGSDALQSKIAVATLALARRSRGAIGSSSYGSELFASNPAFFDRHSSILACATILGTILDWHPARAFDFRLSGLRR